MQKIDELNQMQGKRGTLTRTLLALTYCNRDNFVSLIVKTDKNCQPSDMEENLMIFVLNFLIYHIVAVHFTSKHRHLSNLFQERTIDPITLMKLYRTEPACTLCG